VKARFPIKSENVDAFLRGEYDMEADFKAMLAKGKKTQAEVDSMRQLAREVQESVQERKLEAGKCVCDERRVKVLMRGQ